MSMGLKPWQQKKSSVESHVGRAGNLPDSLRKIGVVSPPQLQKEFNPLIPCDCTDVDSTESHYQQPKKAIVYRNPRCSEYPISASATGYSKELQLSRAL